MTDIGNSGETGEHLGREAWRWVLHMTSGDATKADIAALQHWCAQSPQHAAAFDLASGAWRSFGPAAESVARQTGQQAARHGGGTRQVITRRAVLGGAVATAAAGGAVMVARPPLGLWPSFEQLTADYRTAAGEQRRIVLADSGSVEMNTRTSIDIRRATGNGDRIELIAGETAISAGARTVEVVAAQGRAWADNAQFNVRCDGAEVCTTCLGGAVQVEQHGQSITLRQKQQVSYARDGFGPIETIDAALVAGWRDGDLYFRNEPLVRVIDEVNRYWSGQIFLMNSELGRRRITAHFKLDRLGAIVSQLRETFGARVTSLPGGLVLVS
jgi:transmembrane sensor